MSEEILGNVDRTQLLKKLTQILGEKRLKHVLGVEKMALLLAERYNADLIECRTAALFHDFAKYYTIEECWEVLNNNNYDIDDIEKYSTNLMHSKVSAFIAQNEFGVKNTSVLSAISNHTTGAVNMSLVDKIIFIADAIEENRVYNKVDLFRDKAFENIDEALLMILDNQISFLFQKKQSVHPESIRARDFLLKNKDNKRGNI